MRIKCLIQVTTAVASRFEPGTSRLRIHGLIHGATTAQIINKAPKMKQLYEKEWIFEVIQNMLMFTITICITWSR